MLFFNVVFATLIEMSQFNLITFYCYHQLRKIFPVALVLSIEILNTFIYRSGVAVRKYRPPSVI